MITAQQAMAAMPSDRMLPVPVYIAKSGAWYTGEPLLHLERYKDIDRADRLVDARDDAARARIRSGRAAGSRRLGADSSAGRARAPRRDSTSRCRSCTGPMERTARCREFFELA